jgi:hypothetical protein
MIQVEVFWVVKLYSDVVKMEAARSLKWWYPTTTLHGVMAQKALI